MIVSLKKLLVGCGVFGSVLGAMYYDASAESVSRPLVHYTPKAGWMNDLNGLFYDRSESTWHIYYQYNPNDTVWGSPLYWGHASSKDLTTWTEHADALSPSSNDSSVFSGCVVVDRNNTSGFFNDSINPEQRVVALYTEHSPVSQRQFAAYSLDGGYTFEKYEHNPVLDGNSTQFRDPKVIWHEETEKWVMTATRSHEYAVQIFSSSDLKSWELESNFTRHGFLGYQYECPGLAKVPIVGNSSLVSSGVTHKWVMFLSINPGSPMGGSFTQYFVGDFDGKVFTPDSAETRLLDYGKDYYALQTFSATENDDVLGLAWASNWDYAAYVPTYPWRGSMSLVRNFTLREYQPNSEAAQLNLFSEPIINYDALRLNQSIQTNATNIKKNDQLFFNLSSSAHGLLDLSFEWTVNKSNVGKRDFSALTVRLIGATDKEEYLELGYEANAQAFFFNRGNSNVNSMKENSFYSDKMSANVEPYKLLSENEAVFKVHAILDRNIAEIYLNDGVSVTTNTFFLTDGNFIGALEVRSSVDDVYTVSDFKVNQLAVKEFT